MHKFQAQITQKRLFYRGRQVNEVKDPQKEKQMDLHASRSSKGYGVNRGGFQIR